MDTPPAGWVLHSSGQSVIPVPLWRPSERADGEREVAPWWRDDVALLPGQPQQQVLVVQAPAVDPGALQPGGDVMLLAQAHRRGGLLIRQRADWLLRRALDNTLSDVELSARWLLLTFVALGNSTGTTLKLLLPCWMYSVWICVHTVSNKQKAPQTFESDKTMCVGLRSPGFNMAAQPFQ